MKYKWVSINLEMGIAFLSMTPKAKITEEKINSFDYINSLNTCMLKWIQ